MKKDSKKNKEREDFNKELNNIINSDIDNLTPEEEQELANRLSDLIKNAPKPNPVKEFFIGVMVNIIKILSLFIINIAVFGFMQSLISYSDKWMVIFYCAGLAASNNLIGIILRIFIKHPLKYLLIKNVVVMALMIVVDIFLGKWFAFDDMWSLVIYFIATGVLVSITYYFMVKKYFESR